MFDRAPSPSSRGRITARTIQRQLAQTFSTVGVLMLALLAPCPVARAVENTWVGPDLASWNVFSNWSNGFTPNASFHEAAVIDNFTTVVLSTHAQSGGSNVNVAGVRLGTTAGSFGGLLISDFGNLPCVPASGESGAIAVGIAGQGTLQVRGRISGPSLTLGGASGSSISLDGAASLTVAGAADLQRTMTITGSDVDFSAGDDVMFGSDSLLIAIIVDASLHSPVKSGGDAMLDGTFRPLFSGVTPALGDTWDIIDAQSITGSFATLDTSAAPPLPPGESYALLQATGGVHGQVLQLAVVPEPSAMGMTAAGALFVLTRRRSPRRDTAGGQF